MNRSPLTVLQFVPALESGGVERGTLEVGAELVRRGHRSLVVSAGGRMVEQLEAEGSVHVACPVGRKSPLTLRWVPFLTRLMRDQQVDVIDIHSRLPGWMAWLAWKRLPADNRPRFLTTLHGQHSVGRYSEIMVRGEHVIVVSRTIYDYALENYPCANPGRITLVHRGVDDDQFPHGYRPTDDWRTDFFREYPDLSNQKLITLPGRITRLKGHHDFVDLVEGLRQRSMPVHGLIVGGADRRKQRYLDELKSIILSRGLSNAITFTGPRSDIRDVYAISDVVVSLSSRPESFGRTVLESLKLGTPVAGYAHGGVGEVLNDVYPFGAVTPRDHRMLLERTAAMVNGNAPAVRPVTGYTLQAMLDRTIDVYETLVDTARVRELSAAA